MPEFLLDANISPLTASFLRKLGYKVKTLKDFNLSNASDEKIVQFAQKKKFTIITLDLDFGRIYFFSDKNDLEVIVLRLSNQTVESINDALLRLHHGEILRRKKITGSLIIVDEKKIRIRTKISK